MRFFLLTLRANDQDEIALRLLLEKSSPRLHEWTNDPSESDYIIVTGLDQTAWQRSLRTHPLIERFRSKCYVVYHWRDPFGFLPGIYTDIPHAKNASPRSALYRSGLYWPAHHTNSLVREHRFVDVEKQEPPRWLFSFQGRNSHPVREKIFRLQSEQFGYRAHLSQTDDYDHWRQSELASIYQKSYYQVATQSAFGLCPRGLRRPSIRLFEMMQLGICPVVISDGYQPPDGPAWNDFCLFVSENEVDQLWPMLFARRHEAAERGRLARLAWDKWFQESKQFNYIATVLSDIAKVRPTYDERIIVLRDWLRIARVLSGDIMTRLRRNLPPRSASGFRRSSAQKTLSL